MALAWRDATTESYWTITFGTWNGAGWNSGDFGGYQFVVLSPGSWATGYAPGKIRVTYSLSSLSLSIVGTSASVYDDSVDSGEEVDISAVGDLTVFQFGGTETLFTVSKIEIYGESLDGEEDQEAPAVTPGTSETWRLKYRPGGRRALKHRPFQS